MILLQIDVGTLLIILLIIMLIATVIPNLLSGEEKEKNVRPKIFTEISCLNNDYSETREYVPGDYVGKILQDRKCPKCGSQLYIKGIYSVYPEERKKESVFT
jgi:predicted nucleic-acid-binding Zn-ribbon protein